MYPAELLQRFGQIHEVYLVQKGKTREKYQQRIDLEFQSSNLVKSDLDLIDSYFEHKRFLKQKQKALRRDLHRDRINLKEKTVAMIE